MLFSGITLNDFLSLNLNSFLESNDNLTVENIRNEVFKLIKNYKEPPQSLILISELLSILMNYRKEVSPFSPRYSSALNRLILPNDIDKNTLEQLYIYIGGLSKSYVLKAYLYEICIDSQIKKIDSVILALKSYEKYIYNFLSEDINNDNHVFGLLSTIRSLKLCEKFNKHPEISSLKNSIIDQIKHYFHTKISDLSHLQAMVSLLFDMNELYDDIYISQKAFEFYKLAFRLKKFKTARKSLKILLTQYRRLNNTKYINRLYVCIAKTYILEAKQENRPAIQNMLFKKAYNVLILVPNKNKIIKKLIDYTRNNIITTQQEICDNLSMIEVDVLIDESDPTYKKMQEYRKNILQNKSLFETIMRFSFITIPLIKKSWIKELSKISLEQTSFQSIFYPIYFDSDALRIKPTNLQTDSIEEKKLESQIRQNLRIVYASEHNLHLIPSLNLVIEEHNIHDESLNNLFVNNRFIPIGHSLIFKKGIIAGFQGDFATAMHLLVPQVENSLRYIYKIVSGKQDVNIFNNGDQDRLGLERLLNEPKIIECFGIDYIFHLKSILLDQTVMGLRHSIAHGYASLDELYSPEAKYLWWLILRLLTSEYYPKWIKTYQPN